MKLALLTWYFTLFFSINLHAQKRISFSFDDAPRLHTSLHGKERSQRIVATLKAERVKAVFYVNTSKVTPEGKERLQLYASEGHVIGNHTHCHKSANSVLEEVFLVDFEAAHKLLTGWGFMPKYFRYPFLHRGKTLDIINEIHKAILSKGYTDAFVTVDNYDWYMDKQYQDALEAGQTIHRDNLKKYYVKTLFQGVEHYEALANKIYDGRSPAHVMLLHENDLAALYLGDFIRHLKENGWEIVDPKVSYADPDLKRYPSTVLRHGQGRVVAHATEMEIEGPLISGLEDEEVLDQLWVDYKIVLEP